MEISSDLLAALNRGYEKIFFDELKNVDIKKTSRYEEDLKKWRRKAEPLFGAEGDLYFSIDLQIAGQNGMGGQFGGLDLRLTTKSLHRNEDLVYGYSFESVPIAETSEAMLGNLRASFQKLLRAASQDLRKAIAEDQKHPRKFFTLAFDNAGLDTKQIIFVHQSLLDCLVDRVAGQYLANARENNAYRIIYRLKRNDEKETEEDYINSFAETIRFSVGNHGKYDCSLWRSPMEGYKPNVEVDSLKKRIVVSWKKEK